MEADSRSLQRAREVAVVTTQSVPYGEDAELEGCVQRRVQFLQTGIGFWSTAHSAAPFDDRDEWRRVKTDLYFRINPVQKCVVQMCSRCDANQSNYD